MDLTEGRYILQYLLNRIIFLPSRKCQDSSIHFESRRTYETQESCAARHPRHCCLNRRGQRSDACHHDSYRTFSRRMVPKAQKAQRFTLILKCCARSMSVQPIRDAGGYRHPESRSTPRRDQRRWAQRNSRCVQSLGRHGVALVSDVGMTGPMGGVQGYDPTGFVTRLRSQGDAQQALELAIAARLYSVR